MSYQLTKKAEEDLISIAERGIELFGERQAQFYHKALLRLNAATSANPKMARERNELTPPVRVHPFKAHVLSAIYASENSFCASNQHGREDWLSTSD